MKALLFSIMLYLFYPTRGIASLEEHEQRIAHSVAFNYFREFQGPSSNSILQLHPPPLRILLIKY